MRCFEITYALTPNRSKSRGNGEEGHGKIIMHLMWIKYQIFVTLRSLGETTVDLKLAFLNRLVKNPIARIFKECQMSSLHSNSSSANEPIKVLELKSK